MGKISWGGSQETGVFVKRSNPRAFEYWRESPSVNTTVQGRWNSRIAGEGYVGGWSSREVGILFALRMLRVSSASALELGT